MQRYPESFAMAYLDWDNFKCVNGTMGQNVGDKLWQTVSRSLSSRIRTADFAARLGGDEFAILFPVLDKESAMAVLEKLQSELTVAMLGRAWPVTFSIGAITLSESMGFSRAMIEKGG